jgi:hypothetical protein
MRSLFRKLSAALFGLFLVVGGLNASTAISPLTS